MQVTNIVRENQTFSAVIGKVAKGMKKESDLSGGSLSVFNYILPSHGQCISHGTLQVSPKKASPQSRVMLSIFSRRVPEGTLASAISPAFLPMRAAPIGDLREIFPASRSISCGLTI